MCKLSHLCVALIVSSCILILSERSRQLKNVDVFLIKQMHLNESLTLAWWVVKVCGRLGGSDVK